MAINWTDSGRTSWLNMPSPPGTIRASDATFKITIPTVQASITGYGVSSPVWVSLGLIYTAGQGYNVYGEGLWLKYGSTKLGVLRGYATYAVNADAYANITWTTANSFTLNTSDYFNSSNSTTRSLTFSAVAPQSCTVVGYDSVDQGSDGCTNPSDKTLNNITVTLDVPPTFNSTQVSFDTPYVYTGLTTASVTISDATAYYGGTISDVTLQIGTATDSISGDGTLSILLDTVGTFTPTVTATDSRGQTKTITLDPITVSGYNAPTVSFTADRTDSTGVPDDEGTYATLDATFRFTDVVANLIAPSVVLTDENGTQTTPTVTWYSSRAADGTLSGSVTWSNLSYGDTVYGLVPGLNTNYSYQISVRPRDTQGTGTAVIQTVAPAFYTVDFLAGGHGIAFGQPASTTGFECNMPTTFHDTVNIEGDADFGADVFIELPNYSTSGVDKDIYDAVVALGWDSDVLIN